MRRWAGGLMATALALSSVAVAPLPVFAAEADSVVIVPRAEKDYLDYASFLLGVLDEASNSFNQLGEITGGAATGDDEAGKLAYWQSQLPKIHAIRTVLNTLMARVDALPPFHSTNGAYNDMAADLARDTRTYLTRVDAMLVAMESLVDAAVAKDQARIEAALTTLRGSIAVLIDGQRTLVRARQAMVSKSTSTWHELGIFQALYSSMGVVVRVAMSGESPRTAAASLRRYARDSRAYARSGRPCVAAERTGPRANQRISDLDIEALAIGDEMADWLERFADELEASDNPGEAARKAIEVLAGFETREMDITDEQVRIMNSLHS